VLKLRVKFKDTRVAANFIFGLGISSIAGDFNFNGSLIVQCTNCTGKIPFKNTARVCFS